MRKQIAALLAAFMLFLYPCKAESLTTSELIALSEDFLPSPYAGTSYQQNAPFEPCTVSPETFGNEISKCKSPEELCSYLGSLGLTMDIYDAEYVYFYRERKDVLSFTLKKASRLIAVSYSYPRETNDNCVFLFWEKGTKTELIDCIFNFGEIKLLTDGKEENIWLVGKTGHADYQTERWYHLNSQCFVLSYLLNGVQADRTDYHFKTISAVLSPADHSLEENAVLTVLSQISAIDLTSYSTQAIPHPKRFCIRWQKHMKFRKMVHFC